MDATVSENYLKSDQLHSFLNKKCFQQIKTISQSVLNLKTPAKKYLYDRYKNISNQITDRSVPQGRNNYLCYYAVLINKPFVVQKCNHKTYHAQVISKTYQVIFQK